MSNEFHIRTDKVVLDNFNNQQQYQYLITYDTASKQMGYYTGSGYGGGAGSTITINNNANNSVLTATGNAGDIQAEANLTFDGTKLILTGSLIVSGSGSFTNGLTVTGSHQVTGSIGITGSLNIGSSATNNLLGTRNTGNFTINQGTAMVIEGPNNGPAIAQIVLHSNTTDIIGPNIDFLRSYGNNALTDENNRLGELNFWRAYGVKSFAQSAYIRVSTISGSNISSTPAAIYFGTTPSGSITPVERVVITETGNVGIGPFSASFIRPTYTLHVSGSTSSGSLNVNNTLYVSSSRVGINIARPNYTLEITGSGPNGSLDVADVLYVSSSRVGINNSIPTYNLDVSGSTNVVRVKGSGSVNPLFNVEGSLGELFSVTDNLSGSLFSVNDSSGIPVLEVFSDNTTLLGTFAAPSLNTTVKRTINTSNGNVIYQLPTSSYDGMFVEYSIKSGSTARIGDALITWVGNSVTYFETTASLGSNQSNFTFGAMLTGSNFALTGSAGTNSWTIKTIIRGI